MKDNEKLVVIDGSPKEKFVKDGILHELITKSLLLREVKVGSVAGVGCYRLSLSDGGESAGYAVVNFRCRLNRFENDAPYYALPSNESFGVDGFSKFTFKGAMEKYSELYEKLIIPVQVV